MDVIVHEYIGVQDDTRVEQGLAQQMLITPPIAVIKEAGQPIVAALDNVLRNVWKIESGQAGHAMSVAARRAVATAANVDFRVGNRLIFLRWIPQK
jgi:hypothetical protein